MLDVVNLKWHVNRGQQGEVLKNKSNWPVTDHGFHVNSQRQASYTSCFFLRLTVRKNKLLTG